MNIELVQILRLHCQPRKIAVQTSGNRVATRHWMANFALALIALPCLAPRLATATDKQEAGATQSLPSGGIPSSPVAASFSGTNVALVSPGGTMDILDGKQKLGVGDTVTFRVLEDQEPAKSLSVSDAGELDVPELGLVKAVDKTCKQLAFEIKSKLEETTYYHATVMLGIRLFNKTLSGRRVYLAGEVRRAGPQEIPAGETWTVSKAILNAGGFTEYADKKKVRLVRSGSKRVPGKTLIANVAEIWEKGRTELDLPVESEDLIYVPARGVNFY